MKFPQTLCVALLLTSVNVVEPARFLTGGVGNDALEKLKNADFRYDNSPDDISFNFGDFISSSPPDTPRGSRIRFPSF